MAITYGYAKDHRPDLQQAVLALRVTQDGGVPLMRQSGDGNASDTMGFKKRCAALSTPCAAREPRAPGSLVPNSPPQRMPPTGLGFLFFPACPRRARHAQVIARPGAGASSQPLHETVRYQRVARGHEGRAPTVVGGLVTGRLAAGGPYARQSPSARVGAGAEAARPSPGATRCPSETDAWAALETIAQRWRSHQRAEVSLTPQSQYLHKRQPHRRHLGKRASGRSTPAPSLTPRRSSVSSNASLFRAGHHPPIGSALSDCRVVGGYEGKARLSAATAFSWPPCFLWRRCASKSRRDSPGLLMVMTLAWLIYSVAQRRMRPWCGRAT